MDWPVCTNINIKAVIDIYLYQQMSLRAKNAINCTACTKAFVLLFPPSLLQPPPESEKKGANVVNVFSPDFSLTKE